MESFISFFGLIGLVFLAWLMSSERRRFPWRVVILGVMLQFIFAWIVLKTGPGQAFFRMLGDVFTLALDYVDAGAGFVFGPEFKKYYFAFKVLSTIIFFSALMSLLYYIGIIQWIVRGIALVMQRALNTSGAETLAAAVNIFVGQTEAPLVVKPYLASMTRSELMAVMVGGFANIAGGVLGAYVSMGIDAAHLITASVISAPASLLIAKVMQPETERPMTLGAVDIKVKSEAANSLDAIAIGAQEGLMLALNVGAMLIAFLGLIAMFDGILGWISGLMGQSWSLSLILSYLFAPIAYMIGIPSQDILPVGELLGLKMAANEFIAYDRFSKWLAPDSAVQLTERSKILVTYALCGFANFGSIGIQIGGIAIMAPNQRQYLSRMGLRAMLGGTLATLMTACIAGLLI